MSTLTILGTPEILQEKYATYKVIKLTAQEGNIADVEIWASKLAAQESIKPALIVVTPLEEQTYLVTITKAAS